MLRKWRRRRKQARIQKKADRRRHGSERGEIAEDSFWAGSELSEPLWSRMFGGMKGFLDDLF